MTPRFLAANKGIKPMLIFSSPKEQAQIPAKAETDNPPTELTLSKQCLSSTKEDETPNVLNPSKFGKKLVLPITAINFKSDKI